jgi:hypothetical protein
MAGATSGWSGRLGVRPPDLPVSEVGASSVVDRIEVAQHVL